MISASAAILGALAGASSPLVMAKIERVRRRNSMLLGKLDEWMVALSEAQKWHLAINQFTTIEELRSHPLTECSRLQSLTILYFPELNEPVSVYMTALKEHYLWSVSCVASLGPAARLDFPLATWLLMSQDLSSRTTILCNAIQTSQTALIAVAQLQARHLLRNS